MNDFLKEIFPLGVLVTLIGTFITIYYTRLNLKTTKYIDTITTERIKWIEKLRDDLSLLTSWITIYNSNHQFLNKLIQNYEELDNYEKETNPHEDEPWPLIIKDMSDNKSKQNFVVNELKGVTRQKIIEKIYLLKLRLNPGDDTNVILLLDELLEYFTPSEFDCNNYDMINKKIGELISLSQQILKSEWDKVKKEAKKGK